MFTKIMVPIDLGHADQMDRAVSAAVKLAGDAARIVFVGAAAPQPSSVARSPEEFGEKLAQFAADAGARHGVSTDTLVEISHDPATDMDDVLIRAVKDSGADCVVMASHDPNLGDRIWPSNGSRVASHAHCSVFLVRP